MYKNFERLKKLILLIFGICCVVSCKKEKAQGEEAYDIILDIWVLEDDRFKVYFIDEGSIGYNESNKVEIDVKGMDSMQKLKFSLPKIPQSFRIDLGETGHETFVAIPQILIRYQNRDIMISQKVFHRFFKSNIYLQSTPNGYHRLRVANRYDPFLESTALLQKKLDLTFRFN